MILGLLLARAGVDVTVLEKHGDFLRDFRGDTIHPSTLELMRELELLDEFLRRPHQQVPRIGVQIGEEFWPMADFTNLPTTCKYIALMPQWDFLDFLAEKAQAYPGFHLHLNTKATNLIKEGDRIVGIRAEMETKQSVRNSGPPWWLVRTDVIPPCGPNRNLSWKAVPRPWTCSGCAFLAGKVTASKPSDASCRVMFSS